MAFDEPKGEGKTAPYDSSHIREMVKHCIPLRYGDTTDIAPDLRLTLQNAGHKPSPPVGTCSLDSIRP